MELKNILLIDDDYITLFLTSRIIETLGIKVNVWTVESGKEALKLLKKLEAQNQIPELMLVDINMPEINGFEFLNIIKLSGIMPNLKVFFLSNTKEESHFEMANKLGAIKILKKHLDPEEFSKELKKMFTI